MKKTIILIMAVMAANIISAQTVNVHFKNGQQVQFNSANVDYVDFSEKAPDPTITAEYVVDLGLSVYWASCNLGAESPEEFGEYYSWGETKPKSSYNPQDYAYYNAGTKDYIDIGKDISGTEYDAATVNLGSDWRMPTYDEMRELVDKCVWERTTINNVIGYKVVGPNGNSIFLPETFYKYSDKLSTWGGSLYRSGTLSHNDEAYNLYLTKSGISISAGVVYYGLTIRPVTNNPNAGGAPTDHSQDYLVTDKVSASFLGGAMTSINGRISSGSSFNVKFSNNSSESVTLTKIQLNDGQTGSEGNNMLSEEVEVPAGTDKSYTVTVGANGIYKPIISFSYRYNRKIYKAEAEWKSNF